MRVQDGEQFGDLIEFCDFDFIQRVAKVNGAAIWSLAQAPGTPRGVTLDASVLTNNSTLTWDLDPSPAVAGYEIVWRATDEPLWTSVISVGLVSQATVVVLCLPRGPDTVDLIAGEELKAMRAPAVLINVARGGIVNEGARLEALKQGWIAGAATDVFAKEPAGRGDSPLLSAEAAGLNLVLTPHLAWFSEDTLVNLQNAVKYTVERWCAGETINDMSVTD